MSLPRPLLAFDAATVGAIPAGPRTFPPQPKRPSPSRQGERITPQFSALSEAIEGERMTLIEAGVDADPELVVVFDLVATVDGFLRAVRDIGGLDFLADVDEEKQAPDGDFFVEKDGAATDALIPQSLYMLMTNAQAVQELVRLFELWRGDPSITFDDGLNPLKAVFANLRGIRRWGPADRVRDTGLLERWAEDLEVVGTSGSSRVEVELWYRELPDGRAESEVAVRAVIDRAGGQVLQSVDLESIRYHAILADIPTHEVEAVLADGVDAIELLATEAVMFVSPSTPMSFQMPEATDTMEVELGLPPTGAPRLAVLDGLPLANHVLLEGRLVLDDPDDLSAAYTAGQQLHGTSMASITIHGDLSLGAEPTDRPVYIRPVLVPHPFVAREEITPPDVLLVDLVHRCFHRMFEGDAGGDPAAPSVRVVNLSIGDPTRAFVRHLSPLARLLDWCAHYYNVLIVVSAGNHRRPLTVPAEDLEDRARGKVSAIQARNADSMNRRLLSPGEAVNVLTVGALHEDGLTFEELSDGVVDLNIAGLPAAYSPIGHGFRRAVKPEVYLPGGRQLHHLPPPGASGLVEMTPAQTIGVGPGIRSAVPGSGGDRTATAFSHGTSNAAALASRQASRIISALETAESAPGQLLLPDAQYHPVAAKALLVHAATWGDSADRLAEVLGFGSAERREQLSRLLGFGAVDLTRVASAATVRPVLIGAGSIRKDKRHTYSFPLPPSLSTRTWWRRLTITLAWLSPIHPRSHRHRMARVYFSPPGELLVRRTDNPWQSVLRGTVQHEVLEGDSAVVFDAGDHMEINVDCRVDVGSLNRKPVRYAIVASLEIRDEVGVDIHGEIETQLRERIRERARQRT